LTRIAAHETDDEARDRAADKLLEFAVSPTSTDASARDAARGLSDARRLSTVAKTSPHAAARLDALERISDEGALGAIARHAKDESTARAALDRLANTDKILDVVLNSDHRDVSLAAFDRVILVAAPAASVATPAASVAAPAASFTPADVALLATIEARAQQKPVAKKARAILQEIEDAERVRRVADEDRRQRLAGICELTERLVDEPEWSRAETELTRLSAALAAETTVDADTTARFDRAVTKVHDSIAAHRREAEEAEQRTRARAEALATREALCAQVETLDGDHALEQLSAINEEWQSLAPVVQDGPEASRLAERFAGAATACRKRHELGAQLAETRLTLEALVVEAETLPSLGDATAAGSRWQALAREARGLAAHLSAAARPAADLEARLHAVDAAFAAREADIREAAAKVRLEFVQRLQRLNERAIRASQADAITLREGERLMRDIRAALDEQPKSDVAREIADEYTKLRSNQEKVAPRVRELREMDDWRRFANAQQQDQLILQAETLVATLAQSDLAGRESNIPAAAKTLRDLHLKWKDSAEAPRDQAQKLWERFRTATDLLRLRCETHFSQLRKELGSNLEQKTAIVDEAEKLAASSEWAKTAARLEELQTAWAAVGPVPRDRARDLAQRFRTATNQFFSRRREEVTTRKKVWTDNFARKEALCVRAEQLAESLEWDSASSEMKRLQVDWKTIGPVRRSQSEVLWARFRAAADRFFERYHNRHQITIMSKLAEREAMVVELETLASAGADAPSAGVAERVQELRSTWNRSVPIPSAEMKVLMDRWHAAFGRVIERWTDAFRGSEFDPDAIRERMNKLIARVEVLAASAGQDIVAAGKSQTELLAAKLRSALASNAMGGAVNDESKWRTAGDTVRDAQSAWLRLAPLTGDEGRALETRFQGACRRVMDHVRRHTTTKKPGPVASHAGRRLTSESGRAGAVGTEVR
jgi:hypothetical protein